MLIHLDGAVDVSIKSILLEDSALLTEIKQRALVPVNKTRLRGGGKLAGTFTPIHHARWLAHHNL